jgi:pyrroline-5-carboxylate reductase
MGSAILRAVLDLGLYSPDRVHISSPVHPELELFACRGCRTGSDNRQTVRDASVILLAVRPHQISPVLEEVAGVAEGKCFISIAAGVTVASIKKGLPQNSFVLRVMPNLPLAYGLGATVMAAPEGVPERFVEAAKAIFGCGGIVEVLDEDRINAATALGGSAVAYFFRIASVMAGWAEKSGIPRDIALRVAAQTMSGAARMLTQAGRTPEELAGGVAVPGGTTEAAFKAFDRERLDKALLAGMDACRDRGIELVSKS